MDEEDRKELSSFDRPTVYRRWVLASTIGWALGPITAGIAQWLVLRRHNRQVGWWALATIVGFLVGRALAPGGSASLLGAAVIGAVIGIMQWLVLRRLSYGAGWWILASIIGFALGITLGFGVTFVVSIILFDVSSLGTPITESSTDQLIASLVGYLIFGALRGLISGAITGIALVWLFRHPHQEA